MPGPLTGPQGITGAQGAAGAAGSQGTTGSQGNQGSQGAQGTQGTQGSQGAQGNPASSVYRTLFRVVGRGTTAAASGTTYQAVNGQSDQSAVGLSGGPVANFVVFALAATDHAITGLTTKLLLKIVEMNTTAPAVTITAGLYPVTVSASAMALGTVVSGSTVAFTTPSGNTINTANSGDFNIPADGTYAVGYTVSGTPSGIFSLQAAVLVRNV